MLGYLGKRLASLVGITIVISVLVFLLVHLLPGDPTVTILGGLDTPSARHQLDQQLGLNRPLVEQYFVWARHVIVGNLGQSYITHEPVTTAIGQALPIDAELVVLSQIIAVIISIPAAMIAALRPNSVGDVIGSGASFALLSLPSYVAATILVAVIAVGAKLLPPTGWVPLTQSLSGNLKSAILPAIALALGSVAVYYRLLRSELIGTLQEDFVTLARAKGLSTPYIMVRHALRPSSFSLLAGAGVSIGSLLTGAFVVEYLFNLNGLGFQLVTAIQQDDYLTIQGIALVAALLYVGINFVVDFFLTMLDPRVRRG